MRLQYVVLLLGFNTVNGKYCCNCVGYDYDGNHNVCFNTVNGKCCCNVYSVVLYTQKIILMVSIP